MLSFKRKPDLMCAKRVQRLQIKKLISSINTFVSCRREAAESVCFGSGGRTAVWQCQRETDSCCAGSTMKRTAWWYKSHLNWSTKIPRMQTLSTRNPHFLWNKVLFAYFPPINTDFILLTSLPKAFALPHNSFVGQIISNTSNRPDNSLGRVIMLRWNKQPALHSPTVHRDIFVNGEHFSTSET